ncbi:MAG: phosphoglycerate mutase family protein [Chryseolinea sp.]
MKNAILILTLSFFAFTVAAQKNTITTFILVRHAEKAMDGTKDPELKPEGVDRATRLADMLSKTPVDAIYSTNFKRTKNTVLPFASARGLLVQNYEALEVREIESMLKKHVGGTILISGHSNTIPWIANLLIGKQEYGDFADDDYGNILIISVVEIGKVAKVTLLRY